MQIINNTGAIIKEQINLGDIDNLNIDDLFKNNTSKKMKNYEYPNWLVSLEIAKELKEIGFKEKCLCYWHEYFHRIECSTDDEDRLCPEYYDYNTDESTTSLPTWEQVFEWFRSKGYHGVIAVGDESGELNEYSYCIDYLNELSSDFEQDSHLTYEEAREALVKALIQTYKSEQL
ncbi:hypothetical protein HMPREF1551_00544 [Capnocytophaga sp. oral taxon 863 str. F0517]|nr:hypothetical protein HMPREF1551_00544 [Capnocytophaga sp. oral taxon 863 str. F0517]